MGAYVFIDIVQEHTVKVEEKPVKVFRTAYIKSRIGIVKTITESVKPLKDELTAEELNEIPKNLL